MARLQTRVLYGLRDDVLGNAHYVSDDEVLYLVGNALALHNFSQRRQRLARLPDKHKINLMSIAPNRRFAALCEAGDKPLISVYDLHTLKRRKLLGIPFEAPGVTSFACVGFSHDSRYLAAVTNESQTMLFYQWEKGKLESSAELGSAQNPAARVHLIACNPGDTAVLAVGGSASLRLLTAAETLWRPYGFSKADALLVTALAWLNGDRLLAGTVDGRLLFLENGDLKNVFRLAETPLLNLRIREEAPVVQQPQQPQQQQDSEQRDELLCLAVFARGFACALGHGRVVLFERDGQHKYARRTFFSVPEQLGARPGSRERSLYRLNSLSASPSGDKLLLTAGCSQLFCATLWGAEAEAQAQVLGQPLHRGPVGGMSVCTWKAQLLTFGRLDRSVRLWDYEGETLLLMKQYLEDVSCVALHPSGLFCLVGFSDKLRFQSLLIDDFLTLREFSVRSCRIAAFSNAGHLFAAVNANIIQVYSVVDFAVRFLLKGHTEIVRAVAWSQDDNKLVSVGSEGAIYEWNMFSGKRSAETVLKGVTLNGIALSADGVTSYAISSDGRIHEIKETQVVRAYNMPGIQPSSLAMGKDDTLMFVTYPGGFVGSVKNPLTDPVELNEYHFHCTDITQLVLTYDEQCVITAGSDGTLCFWKITYADGKTSAISRELLYLDQILIGRQELAEMVQTIYDLNTRTKELETEHAYKTRQMSLQHNDRMQEVHQSYYEAIEELRDKIEKLEDDHANEINSINVQIGKTKTAHEEAMRQMEISYDAKLIVEYEKYDSFEQRNAQMRDDYERQLAELADRSKAALAETIAKYEERLLEKELLLKESHEEMAEQVATHEIIKEQIEDDADREIIDLRATYEAALFDERQLVLKLKGEAGVLRNKHALSLKDLEDVKYQLSSLQEEFNKLRNRKEELDKEVADLKNEVQERDSTIQDKMRNINDLNLTNQELEKIRFVLNHRISELRNQIEPRDKEIAELKAKIADMENELIGLNKTNQNQQLKLDEMREKLTAAKLEIQHESQRRKSCQQLMRKIRIELLNTAGLIQEPNALKSAVIKLYHRYSDNDGFLRNHQADLDAQREFMKQRDHLEKTIAILKKQLAQHEAGGDVHFDRILEENILLLTELNGLREELKAAQRHIADMESLLGLKGRDSGPMEAKAKIAKACHENDELGQNYKMQIQECQKIISVLKDDIERLISKFPDESSTKKPNE